MARRQHPKKKRGKPGYNPHLKAKYERYRRRVGKPRGPGVPGNKAGKNKTPRTST
jgi:hypothetical protein